MKKCLSIALAIVVLLAVTACGNKGSKENLPIDNSKTTIGMMTQAYNGENIAEIPIINYDGENPQLKEFGGKNPEIELINNEIKNGIQQTYNTFSDRGRDGGQIVIKSYPFTSDDYLQIVMTHEEYPSYGSDGDMWSYNFNKKDNKVVSVSDIMTILGITESTITQSVHNLYRPDLPTQSVGKVEAVGFLIDEDSTNLLLEVEVLNAEAESWKHFYSFEPRISSLIQLNNSCLFDPYNMDEMNPPLSYMRY